MIKNYFDISDLKRDQIFDIFKTECDDSSLKNKSIGLIFEKYSTRTRLSFSVGIASMGGKNIDLRYEELNISREESFEDTFRAFNCYLDGLIYRTTSHSKLIEASSYFEKPIINALSDKSHPCQILSDLYTMLQNFGTLELKILWVGDMNNVCYSLIEAINLIEELHLIILTPEEISKKKDWKMQNNIKIYNDIEDIKLDEINVVMTDVFISMNDEDSKKKIDILKNYRVTNDLINKTSNKSIFMHCLPAKIGYEVTEDVIKSSRSIVWKQAYNRLIVQKKLLKNINF